MCVYNYSNEAPEAETNTESNNCGITWNQEYQDMLYGHVLYTYINSGNLLKSRETLQSSNMLQMLINMSETIIRHISSFETFVFVIFSTFSFIIFSFCIYYCNKYLLSVSHVSGTGPGPGNNVVNKAVKNPKPHGTYIIVGERCVKQVASNSNYPN